MKLAPGWVPWVAAPAVASVAALLVWWPLGVALVGLSLFVVWFFRDPDRSVGEGIVSAADGHVRESDGRVVTFLNLHHVHVVRSPFAGRVRSVERMEGPRWPAFMKGAEKNAGVAIVVQTPWGKQRVELKAGMIARRATAFVEPGDEVEKGQRVGMIRFGSRVDVELPDGASPTVERADRVRAGETTIAQPPSREAGT